MLFFQIHPWSDFFLLQNANFPPKQFMQAHEIFLNLGFTPCKAEQPLRGMELQQKESQKG